MTRPFLIAPLLALLAAAPAVAHNEASPAQTNVSIAFANHGGIWNWRPAGDQVVYIEDRSHHWYKATLMRPSFDLRSSEAVGFDTGPSDRLDRFSSLVIRGERFAIQSLERVPAPPRVIPQPR
jgi:hypothetical protein